MEITKDKVQERLRDLEARFKTLNDDLQAVHGAILDCQYWVGVLNEESK